MKKTVLVLSCLFLLGCASVSQDIKKQSASDATAEIATEKNVEEAVPAETIITTKEEQTEKGEKIVKVKIETTFGDIYADLYAEEVPNTVKNFIDLANKGFYDGIIFHRVIPNFMIQTGDPTGTGMGGPGYQFADEFSPKLRHDKPGVLSMANSGPNTNGSQFFITEVETSWLDDRHSVFGQVTDGLDVVLKIAHAPRDRSDKPVQKIEMKKVTILE